MKSRHPVSVQNAAFLFCRVSITALLWAAWFWKLPWLLGLSFLILLFSALLGVDHAPMILLWSSTFGRFVPSRLVTLDRSAMRFAHGLGTTLSGICLLVLLAGFTSVAWRLTFLLAIIKTISALGYCPASKLYTCATGGCCPLSRQLFGEKTNG